MVFIIKYEDHGRKNKIRINLEKRWNSYGMNVQKYSM